MSQSKIRRIRETLPDPTMNISTQLAEYILQHAGDDPDRIRLTGKEIHGYPCGFVADQIEARQRYRRRFPQLCGDPLVIFPPKHNLEQSSSEATAAVKAEFISSQTSRVSTIIDLSAGFGVDALALSRISEKMILVEPDDALRAVAEANLNRLIPEKANWSALNAEDFVSTYGENADWIYMDPSRRKSGNKIYLLEDSAPNPVALMNDLLRIAGNVLIKTSPMLDLTAASKQWKSIKNILIVSVSNECREVLYHITRETESDPLISCINLKSEKRENFIFRRTEEESTEISFADPLKFIFEPNASILKSGAFKLIAKRFGLFKLAPHTHLYTSDKAVKDFPGRIFEIIRPIEKSDRGLKANIISRNHPMSTEEISKKFQVSDGGDDFIIACSGQREKFLLLTRRYEKI